MKYDFDSVLDRRSTNSLKWDIKDNELPMWVADMDFKTAPEITEALKNRAEHGVFGYSVIPDEWYNAYIGWWKNRHSFEIEKDWLIFTTGVIPAISSAVRKLTTIAENVVVLTPVYNIFFNSIVNNGRHVLGCELQYDGENYSIDYEDLEEKLANPETSMMILCNPHNPIGKIWPKETLAKIGELCAKYHVIVLSDEIHCDLTAPGKGYIPFASVNETCRNNSVTAIAPTKAFNIAGLQTAAVVVPNPVLRHRLERGLNTDEVAEPSAFAVTAAVAAFTKGGEWLDELRCYIAENREIVAKFIEENILELSLVKGEATYLLWLDCSKLSVKSDELAKYIREKTGLYLSNGVQYGIGGENFLRMNIACPKSLLKDGLARLKAGIEEFKNAN